MADFNLAGALGGASAGLQGNLPQFQSVQNQTRQLDMAQREQDDARAMERKKTMFFDAEAALKMLEQNNLDGVVDLGVQRLQYLKQLNVDPSDTRRLTQLAIGAKNGDQGSAERLRNELMSTVEVGRAYGVLKAPAGPEVVPNSAIGPGGVVARMNPDGTLSSSQIPNYPQEAAKPENFNQPFLSDGTPNQAYQDYQLKQREAGRTNIQIGQATDAERTAGILANRLDFAQSQINEVLAANPAAQAPGAVPSVLSSMGMDYLARVTNPTERQIIEAAQDDMLDAALTLGTGAAYTKEQLQGYRKSYFPQLGDDQKTIENKAKRLQNLIDGAYTKAGRGAPEQRLSNQQPQPQAQTFSEGQTATNPQTGEKIIYRGGTWSPL